MASNVITSSSSSSSSSEDDSSDIPPFPFDTPLTAPPPRSKKELLEEWIETRAPFANHFNKKDRATYDRVRERRNSRNTYQTKVTNPKTGELARLKFSNKAAVSISLINFNF